MGQLPGIKIKKNVRGEVTHVQIDLKKNQQAIPLLKQMGLLEKTAFEKDVETALTVEEARKHTLAFIDSLPWQK